MLRVEGNYHIHIYVSWTTLERFSLAYLRVSRSAQNHINWVRRRPLSSVPLRPLWINQQCNQQWYDEIVCSSFVRGRLGRCPPRIYLREAKWWCHYWRKWIQQRRIQRRCVKLRLWIKLSAKSGYYNQNQIGHKSKRVLTTSSVWNNVLARDCYRASIWEMKSAPELNPYLHELETHFVIISSPQYDELPFVNHNLCKHVKKSKCKCLQMIIENSPRHLSSCVTPLLVHTGNLEPKHFLIS